MEKNAREQKEIKITCSTNVLAGFMLGLKSNCKFRRILAMEKNEKSHIHVNISQNENAEVKSISKETQGVLAGQENYVSGLLNAVLLF